MAPRFPHWLVKLPLSYRDFWYLHNSVSGLCFSFCWSCAIPHSFDACICIRNLDVWQVRQRLASFSPYLFPLVLGTAAGLRLTASPAVGVTTWVSSGQWRAWKQCTPFLGIAYKNFHAWSFILFPFPLAWWKHTWWPWKVGTRNWKRLGLQLAAWRRNAHWSGTSILDW